MRITAISGAALLASLAISLEARGACACNEEQLSPEQDVLSALQVADYVALVRVTVVDVVDHVYLQDVAVWNPETLQSEPGKREVEEISLVAEFEASHVFKGPDTPMFAVTPATKNGCGVTFEVGETYLIYGQLMESPDQVMTTPCMRTALRSDSAGDIDILERITRRKSVVFQSPAGSPEFLRALGLIHAYAGCGDYRWQDPEFLNDLSEARAISESLAKSEPLSGNSQALRAEIMSLWELRDGGEPAETFKEILALTDEALRIDARLALAHVSRARAYARSYETMQAIKEIQKAFAIDPLLESARLAQAEIYRLDGNSAKAHEWMLEFMAQTQDPRKKANGYEWLGRMWRDIAYHPQAHNREVNLLLAKGGFHSSIQLDPKDPWRMINLATFLNEHIADFAGAEKFASDALELEDLFAADLQLAAARYQALQASSAGMDPQALRQAIADIEAATELSLDDLVDYADFREVVRVRLIRLQRSARSAT